MIDGGKVFVTRETVRHAMPMAVRYLMRMAERKNPQGAPLAFIVMPDPLRDRALVSVLVDPDPVGLPEVLAQALRAVLGEQQL